MRKKVTAVVLAVFVFSLIAASAASLGPIGTSDLGATSTLVASCDSDGVDVAYNYTYSAGAPGAFVVDSVDISGIHTDCTGYGIEVVLGNGLDTVLDSGTAAVGGTSVNVPMTAGTADAEGVFEIGIVISN